MTEMRDFNTARVCLSFADTKDPNVLIGTSTVDCEVKRYVDTRNLDTKFGYRIECRQRITFPNSAQFLIAGESQLSYNNYPILLTNTVEIQNGNGQLSQYALIDYSPKTINAAITRADATDQSTSLTAGNSYISGSSNSQTNSFSYNVNAGFFGDAPTGGGGISAGSSTSSGTESTSGRSRSLSSVDQSSHEDSMSIKDWGSYAQLDSARNVPTWIWTQEYPWNVMSFNAPISEIDSSIAMPYYVSSRMHTDSQVLPPSQLSLLGVDFVSKASWLVFPAADTIPDQVYVSVSSTYTTGSHLIDTATPPNISATLSRVTLVDNGSATWILDLPMLALDPIKKVAVVGFVQNKFDVAPNVTNQFQITADSNDLLVRGNGFNGTMSTDFSQSPVSLTVYFKVDEMNSDVSLILKHWCIKAAGASLSIVVNGDTNNPIVRQVNYFEGQNGSHHVEEISLRYKDFNSVDYCDLLIPGLNTVTITVTGPTGCQYALRAMAVG